MPVTYDASATATTQWRCCRYAAAAPVSCFLGRSLSSAWRGRCYGAVHGNAAGLLWSVDGTVHGNVTVQQRNGNVSVAPTPGGARVAAAPAAVPRPCACWTPLAGAAQGRAERAKGLLWAVGVRKVLAFL